jgi:CheY-like chemotaxis protein
MSANGHALTVLVADDDEEDRGFIKKAWTKSRTTNDLRFVEDGEELTEYLNHAGRYSEPGSAPRPGVILLDLNMPKKDGREALREIKANPELRRIPIVILTTSQAEEDIFRSYDLGANSYITKPVTFEGLVDVLRVLGKYWIEIVDLKSDGQSQSATSSSLL